MNEPEGNPFCLNTDIELSREELEGHEHRIAKRADIWIQGYQACRRNYEGLESWHVSFRTAQRWATFLAGLALGMAGMYLLAGWLA